MAVSDILKDIGEGVKTGAKAVGQAAVPVLGRTAEVLSGQAPQIDEEQRQRKEALEDASLNAQSQILESQLTTGQKYGTLTPEQQQQYIDRITGLYSHPRHAGKLLDKLRQAVYPQGAYAQGPQAPLKNPAPPGGTAAADEQLRLGSLTKEGDINEQERQRQIQQSIDFFKQNMMPLFPADQQATKLNEFIDHVNGLGKPTAEKPPKGMKAMEQGGVFFGIEDQDTGKQYLKAQLDPGGDAPPEAKQMYAAVQKAAKDKQDAADKKDKEKEDSQQRVFGQQLKMMLLGIQRTAELGDIREAQKQFGDLDKQYQTAHTLADDMLRNAPKAKQGDQQAQIAILTDHAGGTTKLAGGRLTKPIMDELQNSLPWLDKVQKNFDSDGYLTGIKLSPDQVDKMLEVAGNRVGTLKDARDTAKESVEEVEPPTSQLKSLQGGAKSYKYTATGPNGHKIGSNDQKSWFDLKTGKQI